MSSVMIPATFAQPFPLTLNVQGFSGGQTGLSPTVAIRSALTTDLYLDFNDLLFKTSGWTTNFGKIRPLEVYFDRVPAVF